MIPRWQNFFLDDGQYETVAFKAWEARQKADCVEAIDRWQRAQPSRSELLQVERILASRKSFETNADLHEALADAIDLVLADRGLCQFACHGGEIRTL